MIMALEGCVSWLNTSGAFVINDCLHILPTRTLNEAYYLLSYLVGTLLRLAISSRL